MRLDQLRGLLLAQHADVLVTRGPGDRVGHALKRKDPDEEPATLSL